MHILVFNVGSSTIKYELFRFSDLASVSKGMVDKITKNHEAAIKKILQNLKKKKFLRDFSEIKCVGHRVVHGGDEFYKPMLVTTGIIKRIKALASLAPLHNPANLAGILACKKLLPKIKQAAVFDTGFHHTIPETAFRYAIPKKLADKFKIRRYGFHGISHEYVFEKAKEILGAKKTKRTVTCHLGNGCSITAILNGKSIDTSMGFTPLEGVPMGTRGGDIDPGILLFLMRKGFSEKQLNRVLNHESGFLGFSGISSDLRVIRDKAKKGNKTAKLTLEFFAYRVAKYVAAYASALNGLDCLIFTGGIGENSALVRDMICEKLKFLGAGARRKVRVLAIPTHEEKHIAALTKTVVGKL